MTIVDFLMQNKELISQIATVAVMVVGALASLLGIISSSRLQNKQITLQREQMGLQKDQIGLQRSQVADQGLVSLINTMTQAVQQLNTSDESEKQALTQRMLQFASAAQTIAQTAQASAQQSHQDVEYVRSFLEETRKELTAVREEFTEFRREHEASMREMQEKFDAFRKDVDDFLTFLLEAIGSNEALRKKIAKFKEEHNL